jgi:hypothetical protein
VKILDHLPISTVGHAIALPGGGYYTVKPGQVVVSLSLRIDGRSTIAFPAYLDTGHNHNFSISIDQLRFWLNVDASSLDYLGKLRINGEEAALRKADVLLYRNKKGLREISTQAYGFLFSEDRGIAVVPRTIHHLPILGVRGILRQKLSLLFEGSR